MATLPNAWLVGVLVTAAVVGARAQQEPTSDDLEFFERRVRPILEERCLSCHSSALAKPKGGLTLDTRAGWERGAVLGAAIVARDPDASPLVRAVRYDDLELQMPPKGKLPDGDVAVLEEWVRRGAPDPRDGEAHETKRSTVRAEDHWAFRAVADVTPPRVANEAWVANDVDRFVLARLESEGLAPAAPATKRELLERVSFDLIGLPPTSTELTDFEGDASKDAYERVVDRLLASPHYGERWGRHWLDLARYSDSNGLDENLGLGEAWRYRDWVVRALNADLPYDQFVIDQLAGDLLPEPADKDALADQLTATGFLVLGPKMLAEQDKQKLVMDVVDEQLDVASKAFMGLTVGCARCHDHKFDPIPTRDYYALAGVFKSTSTMANLDFVSRWRERELAPRAEIDAADEHARLSTEAKGALDALVAENDRAVRVEWRRNFASYLLAGTFAARGAMLFEAEESSRGNLGVDRTTWGDEDIAIVHTVAPGLQFAEYDVTVESARSLVLDVRYASAEERPVRVLLNGAVVAETALDAKTGSFALDGQRWARVGAFDFQPGRNVLRFERATDFPHVDKFVLARASTREWFVDGNPWASGLLPEVVRNFAVYVELTARRKDPIFAPWNAFAALASDEWPTRAAEIVAKLRADSAAKSPELSSRVLALLDGLPPRSLEDLAGRYQTLFSMIDAAWREAQSKEGEKPTELASADEEALRRVLYGKHGPFALRSESLEALFPEVVRGELAKLRRDVDDLALTAPMPFARALGVEDASIVDVPVHLRGSHLSLGPEPVPRGVLSATSAALDAPTMPAEHSGRLELARWLVDPRHPLTSRVMANRVWAGHFGRGLVASTSNFGVRGDAPTHPELLDWLAREFVRRDWSLKALHRLIVTSNTYRMSTRGDALGLERDPENRLLARQNRRRLEAEVLRDAWLAVSERLDPALGGKALTTGNAEYVTNDQSSDVARYQSTRRSLYLPIIRNAMYEYFGAFDYNDPSVPIDVRPETVAAPQALFLMNSELVLDCARALAALATKMEPEREGERLTVLWRHALNREPSASERQRAIDFLRAVRGASEAPTAGQATEAPADTSMPTPLDVDALAWSGLAQALLVCNEFLYVD
ncbi:MAG: DUF1549 domain-containing protein [Planctomycetes bacterium]|nr:DUF1549 domain-containing protein [Planctomycetota bacterium]